MDIEFWLGITARRICFADLNTERYSYVPLGKVSFASIVKRTPEILFDSSGAIFEELSGNNFATWELIAKNHLEKVYNIYPQNRNVRLHYAAAVMDLCDKYRRYPDNCLLKTHRDELDASKLFAKGASIAYTEVEKNPKDVFANLIRIGFDLFCTLDRLQSMYARDENNRSIPLLTSLLQAYYCQLKHDGYFEKKNTETQKNVSTNESQKKQRHTEMYAKIKSLIEEIIDIDQYSPVALSVGYFLGMFPGGQQLTHSEIGDDRFFGLFGRCLARQDDNITTETRIDPVKSMELFEDSERKIDSIPEEEVT